MKPIETIKIEPTLSHTFKDQDVTGWLASEKYDGVRAIWDGEHLISRQGKVFDAPKSFTSMLPPVQLDGELYLGRGMFDEVSGIVRRKHTGEAEHDKSISDDWERVVYMVFDVYGDPRPYGERFGDLTHEIQTEAWILVNQLVASKNAQVWALCDHYIALGAEGIMMRNPLAGYEHGRTHNLLKVKRMKEMDATITGYHDGKGRNIGRVGALMCQADGKTFKVGSGLNDELRENPPAVGTVINIQYQEKTKTGVPRFPVYLGTRAD